MLPAEPNPETMLVPLVAAWPAGLAGATVGLRSALFAPVRRPGRAPASIPEGVSRLGPPFRAC
jgi:hypothetical protein